MEEQKNQDSVFNKSEQVASNNSKMLLGGFGAKKGKFILFVAFSVLILAASAVGFVLMQKQETVEKTALVEKSTDKVVDKEKSNQEEQIDEIAGEEKGQENVDQDEENRLAEESLSDIVNIGDFNFSQEDKKMLAENNFFVSPSYYKEFYQLYEGNRYNLTANFITTDSILHNYHLVFDFLLKKIEEEKLYAKLTELSADMLSESIEQYNLLEGTKWENAAKRNVGFFTVASKLLNSSTDALPIVAKEVNQELALIENHQGVAKSPVMNFGIENEALISTPQGMQSLAAFKEDYSQYAPRGHYDKTDELKAYFKAMMWYGRLTFRMKSDDETKSAMLITLLLDKAGNQELWNAIYEPINFFVGKSDDINYYQFEELMEQVYGAQTAIESISNDENKFDSFVARAKKLSSPQINSIPIFEASIQSDREEEIKGFRFMGQRFTVDAAIFQRLIYREVGDKTKTCEEFDPGKTGCLTGARCLPAGLDIPAAMGSQTAKNILSEMGEDEYACYSRNMSKLNAYISSLDKETWTQNLYWSWLYQLGHLLDEKTANYPDFAKSDAWQKKNLNTFLGSWTELKHDTILYSKQVYAEMGAGGFDPEEKDDRGYVEPNPRVYSRIAALLKTTVEGLQEKGLIAAETKNNLAKMEELALSLETISEKELNGKNLTDEEYELIRSYGGQLEHFWLEVNKNESEFKEMGARLYLIENPAAVVADVATDPNGYALEEGTGWVNKIYVAVPIDGKLKIAVGGVYSYYEFAQPMEKRLNDKEWREILNSAQKPQKPSWTDAFISE